MAPDNDLLARVQGARRALALAGPSETRSDGDFQRVSISAQDADVLRDVVGAERPTTVIEIGLAYGSSALAIAEALLASGSHEARHVIIDAHQDEFHDAGWRVLVEAGLGQLCCLVREKSQTALPRLLSEGFEADAAFVDGSHIFHNVFIDLFYLGELVRPGGLVIMDDYDWPSVATAARYFQLNSGWAMEPIPAPTRLRALRLPIPRHEPGFEDFVPFGGDIRL